MEEAVNSCYELFMKYIKHRPSVYYVYQKPTISYEELKENLVKIASLNRIHVFTKSYLTYIMDLLGDYDLKCVDNATKDDETAFFDDLFNYFFRIYCVYIDDPFTGTGIEYCEEEYVMELDKELMRIISKAFQVIRRTYYMVSHNTQEYNVIKYVIIRLLTRCYINQKMGLFNDLIDKIALDPVRIVDDLRVNGINSDNVKEKDGLIFERITSFLASKSQIL